VAAASLVVRISADINDFSSKLKSMTRDVDKASKKVGDIGKAMTIGITLPVAAAAVALSKLGAENEDTAGRMSRVFGRAADAMKGSVKQMMASIPEGETELDGMAISVDHLLQGMNVAPSAAARMSGAVLKLAGDASAFAHVPMAQALDAIERGLAGKTRGLVDLGIVISEADVKQRALTMGLIKQGSELTQSATALAAYNLIMERSSGIQGESARTAGQQGKQFAFLKRDLGELADSLSGLVLPTMSGLAKTARSVVDAVGEVPPAITKMVFSIAGIAAVAGPAILGLSGLVTAITRVAAAARLVFGASALGGLAGALTALGPLALLAGAAVAGIAYKWHLDAEAARTAADDVTKYAAAVDKLTAAQLRQQSAATRSAIDALASQKASLLVARRTAPNNPDLGAVRGSRIDIDNQIKKIDAQMAALRPGFDAITAKIAEMNKTAAGGGGGTDTSLADQLKDAAESAGLVASSVEQIKKGWEPIPGLGSLLLGTLTQVEQILARMPNKMDPIAVKAREIAQSLRGLIPTTGAEFLPPVTVARPALPNPLEGLTVKAAPLPPLTKPLSDIERATREGFRQVSVAIGDTLATNLSMLLGGRGMGAQIGGSIGGAFGSGVGASIGGSIGGIFGNSVVPVVGGIVGTMIGGAIGGLFGHHTKSVDNSTRALDTLATTTERVNEALSNLPQGFKIAYARYLAATPVTPTTGGNPTGPGKGDGDGGGTGGGKGGGSTKSITIKDGTFHIYGVQDIDSLHRALGQASQAQNARGGTTTLRLSLAGA